MHVDLEDVAFWMDAVRNSENPYGVLESFWKGQLKSKIWLIENLKQCINFDHPNHIVIHGGWNGVLACMIFNSSINTGLIRSVDIDENCEETANMICKRQEMIGNFRAVTADMCAYDYEFDSDIVINTSTEHITQEQYNIWLSRVPNNSLIVLQSNNYYSLPEHIRCFDTVNDFAASSGLGYILVQDTLELPMYNRFLLIGRK
tara:strand:- start:1188 stop:1796 length:609 start_codon:yes stop_codon:yes gene_type:complete